MVLASLFEGRRQGFYVDVGAHHPKRFSNTYYFYLRGWRGINIDATPRSMRPFKRVRPLDINLEAAISDQSESLNFHAFNEPALNTFDPALAAERDGFAHYKIAQTIPICTVRLADVLDQHMPANTVIDFMTVDVEGLDLNVLRSNDWTRFTPQFVMAEDTACKTLADVAKSPVSTFLDQQGYLAIAKTARTIFYKLAEAINHG